MASPAQIDTAFRAARAWIDVNAGFYASMIPDSDVQQLCAVIIDAAATPQPQPQTEDPQS
jgi:hypothetical protein